MADPAMRREYPDEKQRAAVANQKWRDRNKKKAKAMKIPSRLMLVGSEATIEAVQDGEMEDDKGKMPKFSMVANTGRPMKVRGFYDPVVVDLQGLSYSEKMPVIEDHDMSRRVGHTESVKMTKDKCTVKGVVSCTGDVAKQVTEDAKNGFPFEASIGVDVTDALYVDKGQKTEVNGRMVKGPVIVARKGNMYEVSVTAIGADRRTSFSVSASDEGAPKIGVYSMDFEQFLKELGLDKDSLSEDQLSNLQAKFDAGINVRANMPDDDDNGNDDDDDGDDAGDAGDSAAQHLQAMRDAEASETDRLEAIRVTASRDEFKSVPAKKRNSLRKKAIKEGWSIDKFELELHRENRPDPGQFAIHTTQDMSDRQAVEASMLMATGMLKENEVAKHYDEKVMNLALSRAYQGYGLHRLMHETISAAGMHYRPGQYDHNFIRTMKEADTRIRAAGDFSTVDVTGILSNIQNKILLAAFSSADQALFMIAAEGSVKDFKELTGYRMTGIGQFQQVPAGGELRHMSLGEESYTVQADTYGAIIQLDRQQIINDDLGAFAQIPRTIGRAAKMKLFRVGWAEFLDDAAFFTAGNNNYIDGADMALGIESLTTVAQMFMQQVDINGDPIDVSPDILLTGSNNAILARQLNQETRIVMETHATGTAKAKTADNPHAGKYTPVSTPWTDTDRVANGLDTAWWLLTSDPDMACLEIRYLNGVRTPVIEEAPTASDVLGMRWIGYFDFGVTKKEWRGGVKSKGAA